MAAPPPLPPAHPAEHGKLRWRCRRGMKELDVLLTRYVNERFCGASILEQDLFKELLESEDSVLYGYCLGVEKPPPRFAALIGRITAGAG
ncbi:MAG: FAD assembly factor SdhE [Steroidobacteraceae bacterium]